MRIKSPRSNGLAQEKSRWNNHNFVRGVKDKALSEIQLMK